MDPLTIFAGITLLAGFFKGAYDFTRGLQEQERQSKLEEQGKDPASLAEKQLQLNENVSKENLDLAKEQFKYQQDLNQKIMDREDNAIQRQVADLRAAGLSPLALTGGASATPLQSAQPVQRDISGINQAMQNMIGAYNDMFNRNMQRRQFALQSKVQTAQAFTQLAELSMQRKKANLENAILGLDYKYYKNHPERNLGLQQVLINAIEAILTKNPSALDTLKNNVPSGNEVQDIVDKIDDSLNAEPGARFSQYGAINPKSKYGHTLDTENYDNDRSIGKLIKEEVKEKYYKGRLKEAIQSDNKYDDILVKLYNTDDYLKKHISLDNWRNAKESFILDYLKYGYFEGHKKYFE